MRALTAAERLAEPRGAKILVIGQSGSGKTSLLRTLDSATRASTLFVDCEGGDLSVLGLPVASVRPQTWHDLRDLACVMGGKDPARPANAPYGHDHYQSVIADPVLAGLAAYQTVFIDSLTQAMRLCRGWAETQPESFSDRGRKDLRGTYGLVAREGVTLLQQFQRGRSRNVIFVAVLERHVDDTGFAVWRPQIEGAKTTREMPAIIDVIVTLEQLDFGDDKPLSRAFVCTSPNIWRLPARDRSGRLEQLEPPNLQHLLDKLLNPASAPATQGA
jgi:energy-coupling factor transporter ATP-binding protein EcfA2